MALKSYKVSGLIIHISQQQQQQQQHLTVQENNEQTPAHTNTS